MTTFLRWIRGFIGLLAGMQAISLLPILTWVQAPGSIRLAYLVLPIIKIVFLTALVFLYGYLRKVINRRSSEVLLKSSWSL